MDSEAKKIIDDALRLNGHAGVMTFPLINGTLMTNDARFRKYFKEHHWTQEMSDYVKSLFE